MALAFASSTAITGYEQSKAPQFASFQHLDRPHHHQSTAVSFSRRRSAVEPLNAEPKRTDSIVSSAATIVAPEVVERVEVEEDYEKLAKGLEIASPLEIMDRALEMFGNDIAIAFSGAEDVALIEYAHLTGRPFRVFSLDTGRLNPETYRFFDAVEKHYNIRIEYMFPDSVEVQALVRNKGLFSFYEDGHQECCRVRKVRPLRRALKGFRAWITGQRKDQSPGTRSEIPIVQVDPSFEGLEGGPGSLVKWNPMANVAGLDVWSFLRSMEVPVNPLHLQGYVSIGCEPCTRPVLPGQHERVRLPFFRKRYLYPFLPYLTLYQQARLCKVHLVLSLGFFEPGFLVTLLFLINVSIKKRNPHPLSAVAFVSTTCLPILLLQIFFVFFSPLELHLPVSMHRTSILFDDEFGKVTAICAYPLSSGIVFAAFGISYGLGLLLSCWRVVSLVINKGTRERINFLAFTIMAALAFQVVFLGLSALWSPESPAYGGAVLVMFLCVSTCAAVGEGILIIKPISDALSAGGDICEWNPAVRLVQECGDEERVADGTQ